MLSQVAFKWRTNWHRTDLLEFFYAPKNTGVDKQNSNQPINSRPNTLSKLLNFKSVPAYSKMKSTLFLLHTFAATRVPEGELERMNSTVKEQTAALGLIRGSYLVFPLFLCFRLILWDPTRLTGNNDGDLWSRPQFGRRKRRTVCEDRVSHCTKRVPVQWF